LLLAQEDFTMVKRKVPLTRTVASVLALVGAAASGVALADSCRARSGAAVTPVIELYTSQGCSSCPPADRWLSSLPSKGQAGVAVIQAFHVAYWDYIGWVDRFAVPVHTQRQRQLAAWNGLRSIYTPQVLLSARDWREWRNAGDAVPLSDETARARIELRQSAAEVFEATVTMDAGSPANWAAYWTVTEDAHRTAVAAGENSGEQLRNDHVVRQYVPAGSHRTLPASPQTLVLHTIAATAGHARAINLVVFDPRNGQTLQALALHC
jgi:hypothetical protein